MTTETAKTNDATAARGWIFYDAACGACVWGRNRVGRLFASRGWEWVPLQTPGTAERLGVDESAFETRMHVLRSDGGVLSNADALAVLCRTVWWLWPLGMALSLPGLCTLGRVGYDWFARNRYCVGGACRLDAPPRMRVEWMDWTPTLLLPAIGAWLTWGSPPWVFMWTLAIAMGLAGKWLTWRDALVHGACPSAYRATGWFLLWPGLDGRAFLSNERTVDRPAALEWGAAVGFFTLGVLMIWKAAPAQLDANPMIAGWLAMSGIVLCLHFGVIRLASILWRHVGVDAQPIMHAPLCATSLAQFWGERWNTAFSVPAGRLALRPLARCTNLPLAGFTVFVMSGLLHELVISLPARAGFGLPTLYFTLQGLGVVLERTRAGRTLGLGRGVPGWAMTLLFTLLPLYWLFHPAFVHTVILPFLRVLTDH